MPIYKHTISIRFSGKYTLPLFRKILTKLLEAVLKYPRFGRSRLSAGIGRILRFLRELEIREISSRASDLSVGEFRKRLDALLIPKEDQFVCCACKKKEMITTTEAQSRSIRCKCGATMYRAFSRTGLLRKGVGQSIQALLGRQKTPDMRTKFETDLGAEDLPRDQWKWIHQ